jgi:hypothetical protein
MVISGWPTNLSERGGTEFQEVCSIRIGGVCLTVRWGGLLLRVNKILIWSRRIFIAVLCLVTGTWIYAEASQWLFRLQAERLLQDLKSIRVGQSSAEAKSILGRWQMKRAMAAGCYGENNATCYSNLFVRNFFPEPLRGSAEEGANNWLPSALDRVGLRNSAVGAGIITEHGVVVQRWYSEEVALPVRDWLIPGRAYEPALGVTAIEDDRFRLPEIQDNINPSHPFRIALRRRGDLAVSFITQESPSERVRLMDFRLSCITQFFPCREEPEILPEVAQLLQ